MASQIKESEPQITMSNSTESGQAASDESAKLGDYTEDNFTNQSLAHVRVLDVGEPAREVARQLGLEVQSALPQPGERPVVLVVSEPSEVDTLLDVENRSWIGCIVAWQLPEESVERLYQLGVSVFVGLPVVGELLHAIEYLPDANEVIASRSFAARLASIEKLLTNASN